MAKTNFYHGKIVYPEYLNTIYGQGAAGGHVHDGGDDDGHAPKINLAQHTTGKLDLETQVTGILGTAHLPDIGGGPGQVAKLVGRFEVPMVAPPPPFSSVSSGVPPNYGVFSDICFYQLSLGIRRRPPLPPDGFPWRAHHDLVMAVIPRITLVGNANGLASYVLPFNHEDNPPFPPELMPGNPPYLVRFPFDVFRDRSGGANNDWELIPPTWSRIVLLATGQVALAFGWSGPLGYNTDSLVIPAAAVIYPVPQFDLPEISAPD